MPSIGNAWINVVPSIKGFSSVVAKEAGKAGIAGSASLSKALSSGLGKLGAIAGITGIGAGVAAGLKKAVTSAEDFEAEASRVKATGAVTGVQLKALEKQAFSLGQQFGQTGTQTMEGVEALTKAGISAQDIMGGGLKGALSLAAAGEMSVGDAAESAASAMTQFGLKGNQVPHVADLFVQAANLAQGSAGDISQAFGAVGSVAAGAGMSIEQVTGFLGEMASNGIIGAEAGTTLKSALVSLQNPSTMAQKTMKKYGVTVYDSNGKMKSLAGIAGTLQTQLGGLTQQQRNAALATIFGTYGLRAANILYKDGAKGVNSWTKNVNKSGAASKAVGIQQDNLQGAIAKLKAAWTNAWTQIGESTQGPLTTITQGVTRLVQKLPAIASSAAAFVVSLKPWAPLIATVGGALLAFGGSVAGILAVAGAFRKVQEAFKLVQFGLFALKYAALTNPFTAIIAGVVALVAAFIIAYKKSATFRAIVNGALNGIKTVALAVAGWFAGPFVNFFVSAWNGIKAGFSAIGTFFTTVWTSIKSIFTGGVNFVKSVWTGMWNALKNTWFFQALNAMFSVGFRLIRLLFNQEVAGLKIIWSGMWAAMRAVASAFMTAVRAVMAAGMAVIRAVIVPALNGISRAWSAVWNAIKAVTSRVWAAISAVIRPPLNAIVSFVGARINNIKANWTRGFTAVKSVASTVMNAVKGVINKALGGIEGAFHSAVGWIGRVWGGLSNIAKKPISFILRTVINGGLIGGFNWVAGKLGAAKMPKVPIPKGFRRGGYTGDYGVGEPAGIVHGREFVMDAKTVRRAGGPQSMEAIRAALRSGAFPVGPNQDMGMFSQNGGSSPSLPSSLTSTLPASLKAVIRKGPKKGDLGFGFNGQDAVRTGLAIESSQNWYRRCLAFVNRAWQRRIPRLNVATANDALHGGPVRTDGTPPPGAAMWFNTHGSAGHVALSVGDGSILSSDILGAGSIGHVQTSYLAKKWGAPFQGWWAPDGANPGADHGFLSGLKGLLAKAAGGVATFFGKFSSPVDWITDHMSKWLTGGSSVLKKIGNNPFTQMVARVPVKLMDAVKAKVKSLFSSFGGSSGTSGNMESWRPLIRQALARTGLGHGKAAEDAWLRQVMSESSGNAHATQGIIDVNSGGNEAYGLLQVIPGTFAQYRDQALPNDRGNAFANAVAAMRYVSARYGKSWMSVIGHGHGYAKGTVSSSSGMHWVGEKGPELVVSPQYRNFRSGSRVYNAQQTAGMLGGGGNITLPVYDRDGVLMGTMYAQAVNAMEDREQMMARIGA